MPEEILDVVDEDDIVIAQELRSEVHRLGLLHRGVHVFLFTRDGRLLVQQRSRHKDNLPLALDCSVSEHLQAGERYRQGALRGLAEELGIQNTRIRPLVKFKMNYGPQDEEICQLYKGRVNPLQVRFDPLEVEGISYRGLDELEPLLLSKEALICSWFEQLLAWYLGRPAEMKVLRTYAHNSLLSPLANRRR